MVKMRFLLISSLFLLISVWSVSSGVESNKNEAAVVASLCPTCVNRIKNVIAKAWTLSDPLSTSYSVLTYSILKIEIPKSAEVCKYLQTSLDGLDGSKIEPVFVLTSAIPKVTSCKIPALKPAVKQALDKILKEGGSSQDVLYAVESSKNVGTAFDGAKIAELLKTSIKSDDSPQSLGYALWATASTYKTGQKLEIWDRIEDVIAQADEVDKQYLQFEGGLSVTAAVINGIIRLAEAANKPLPLSNDQVVKFGNYLVSRKTVTTPRGSWLFSSALDIISKNKFAVPVYIGLVGSNVLTDNSKTITVKANDLMGRPVDVSVLLESLNEKSGKAVGDVQFIQGIQNPTNKIKFSWDLKSKPLPKGFYNAVFSAKSNKNDKTLILLKSTIELKVVGKLGAVTTRVGVADSDQQTKTQWNDLNKGQKLAKRLDLEPAQKLVIKVGASDTLHQVFVLFRNKETKKEVALIAQPETEGKTDYKLELDLTLNAKDLGYNTGAYEVILILGDFLIEDSVEWNLGEVNLQVASGKTKSVNPLYAITYGMKPEIKHEFRKPEPRPPRVLSDAFTVLALVPLLILLVLWIRIGANIKNFPASLSAIAFHLGLAGVFGVYGIFWLQLTMFEALKWMSVPGLITFISGHRMLSQISLKRKG